MVGQEPMFATRAQKAFIATVTIQAIAVLALVALVFRFVEDHVPLTDNRYKTVPCYLALFALGELFELFMTFDALRLRNIIQLIGILIFHACLAVFAGLQIHQTRTALVKLTDAQCAANFVYEACGTSGSLWMKIRPLLIAAPCIIGAAWFVMLFFLKQLYEEFGWAIFHVVGANPKMKTMYQWYQIMICLLKFDFFFFTGVTIQLLIIVLQRNSAEFGVTVAAIPVVLILLVLCGLAVQKEIKFVMTVSLVMMLASLSYFIYKLVRFYSPASASQYETTRATLTTFTVIAFILLLTTFAVGLRCFSDFDRGLRSSKEHSVPMRPNNKTYNSNGDMGQKHGSTSGIPLGPRISIE